MAKEKQIQIEVRDKIATFKSKNFNLVGGNSDYDVVFDFDEDWAAYPKKTAVFVFGKSKPIYKLFDGNVCEGVAINDATMCLIGVFSGDLLTTTPAAVDCVYRSILDEASGEPEAPSENVYNQIIELINKYIAAVDIEGKYAPLVDGKVPTKNLPSYDYDVIITSQEQFLTERLSGKKVLVKDVKFSLEELDFGGAEYVEFCNVAIGSKAYEVTIKNFTIGNFTDLTMGWNTVVDGVNTEYACDDLNIHNFAFVENVTRVKEGIHGDGNQFRYSNGFGIMNCEITRASDCCNITNCHVVGRSEAAFTNCNTISNLHAKNFYSDITFKNCTHLSNLSLLDARAEYINCSNVDPDTCDGYEMPGGYATIAYVDGLVGDISDALDELHTYAQNLVNGGNAE